MSAHTCKTLTPDCYRCELNRIEINSYIDSLRVTYDGVVHDPECSYISRPRSGGIGWYPACGDRACDRCLPDGIPERA